MTPITSNVPSPAAPPGDALLLFTQTFPYGAGETFLETELPYLAAEWERVVLVPARPAEGRRPVPGNVEVSGGLVESLSSRRRRGDLAGVLMSADFGNSIRRQPSVAFSPRHMRRLSGQLLIAQSTSRWIEAWLSADANTSRLLCYSYWMNLAALGLARLRRRGLPVTFVSRAHSNDLYAERHDPPYLPLQYDVVQAADAIFPVSDHGHAYLSARYPGIGRIETARLGVRDPGFTTAPSADGCWRLLSCSALSEVKRVDRLVTAIATLARRHPERRISWDHLGDGAERERIEALAGAVLPSNVRWRLHGQLTNADVMEYYRTQPVDVLINVSAYEGIPVSMMEAASAGVPIVGTAVGGVPEIVDSTNGHLLSPDASPAEVADALVRVCGAPRGGGGLRAGSRALWSERYDADRNYSAFVRRLRAIQGA